MYLKVSIEGLLDFFDGLWWEISMPRAERAQLVMATDMAQWLC